MATVWEALKTLVENRLNIASTDIKLRTEKARSLAGNAEREEIKKQASQSNDRAEPNE